MNMVRIRRVLAILFLLGGGLAANSEALSRDRPPANATIVVKHHFANYSLYEPPLNIANALPKPLPVVAYLHGAGLNDPAEYDRILSDMARAGYVVVFPRYSGDAAIIHRWFDDAVAKLFAALVDLHAGNVGYVEASVFDLALVGHSAGGMYSLKLATNFFLPHPKAIILHDAGGFGAFLPLGTPEPFNSNWLDNLSLSGNPPLFLLIGRQTLDWQFDEFLDGDSVSLGNSIMSGVWSRAWWRTGVTTNHKHAFVMDGGHNEVRGGPRYGPYASITINALDVTFRGVPWKRPRQEHWKPRC